MMKLTVAKLKIVVFVLMSFASVLHVTEANAAIDLGLYTSWGEMRDTEASIAPVQVSSLGIYAVPSFSLLRLLNVGAYAEYGTIGQLTSTAKVDGRNEGASGYLAGGSASIGGPGMKLTAAYTFIGKSTLKKETSLGNTTTLESPKGIHAILSLGLLPKISLDLGFTRVKYNVNVDGVSRSDTRKWTEYRVGSSISF